MPAWGGGSAAGCAARAVPCSAHPWDRPAPGATPAHVTTRGGPAGSPTPAPPQPVPCTHRGRRSADGRSSPGPADGPELQLVPFAAEPGHRTPASLRGTEQHHPEPLAHCPQHLPLCLGARGPPVPSSPVRATSRHPPCVPQARRGTAWQWSRVLGTSGWAGFGSSLALGPPSPEHPGPAQHPWPPATPQHGGDRAGERTRSCLLPPRFTSLKK